MNVFFQNLLGAARVAISAFYANLFSQALSATADEIADWYKLDPIEVDLEDGTVVYAKRVTLPVWDLVSQDEAAEIASTLMLEIEAKHDLYLCSYTGDSEFVVYITNVEIELDALRLAFDDLEEEEEELEEEELRELDGSENAQPQPESGRVLSMVPRIEQAQVAQAPAQVVDADFPEEDFPEEPEPAPVVEAQAPAVELEDAPLVEEEPLPEETPAIEAQAAPAPAATELNAEADAMANALNGEPAQPQYAQEPLTEAETLMVINARSDEQPAAPATEVHAPIDDVVDTGPVKESPEIIAAIHAEKMQNLKDMLPSDTMSEVDENTGVLSVMYSREVNGANVDYIRSIRIANENFQNIRYVDVFYVEDEAGTVLHRTTNAQAVISQLENLNA